MHKIFLCFDHDDEAQVHGLRGLLPNPNHPLTGEDWSLQEPVTNRHGHAIASPPASPAAATVRATIGARLDQASQLVVLIGRNTHASLWCNWEVEEFARRRGPARHIYAMRLPRSTGGALPALARVGVLTVNEWAPDALAVWLTARR